MSLVARKEDSTSTKSVHIKKVKLINCQSHKDSTLEFTDGLNIIRGAGLGNNQGKSVLFKMLKITCLPNAYDKVSRMGLIRTGTEYATVMYFFSDNSCGAVRVYPERVVYYYTDDYENESFETSSRPFPELLRKLSVIVDPVENFLANVIDNTQSLFLVDSSDKANQNLVKLLTYDERLSRVIDLLEVKIKDYGNKAKEASQRVNRLEYQLSKLNYVDVEDLRYRVKFCDEAIPIYETLLDIYESVEDIGELGISNVDYNSLIFLSELFINLEESYDNLSSLFDEEVDKSLFELLDILENLNNSYDEVKGLRVYDSSGMIELASLLLSIYDEVNSIVPVEDSKRFEDILNVCENLFGLKDELVNLFDIVNSMDTISSEVKGMEEKVIELGRVVPCHIYGEVSHVEGECVPISYRSTS